MRSTPTSQVAVFRNLFADGDNQDDHMVGYERWLAEVRAEISPERLVERQPGHGWNRSVAHGGKRPQGPAAD